MMNRTIDTITAKKMPKAIVAFRFSSLLYDLFLCMVLKLQKFAFFCEPVMRSNDWCADLAERTGLTGTMLNVTAEGRETLTCGT